MNARNHASAAHVPHVRLYLAIFGALIFLTVLTVLVSYLHLPKAPAVLIALAIASVKASLVGSFFMHLKGEKALILAVIGVTLFFAGGLLLPLYDIAGSPTRVSQPWPSEQADKTQ